jgi:hypothetical protein
LFLQRRPIGIARNEDGAAAGPVSHGKGMKYDIIAIVQAAAKQRYIVRQCGREIDIAIRREVLKGVSGRLRHLFQLRCEGMGAM